MSGTRKKRIILVASLISLSVAVVFGISHHQGNRGLAPLAIDNPGVKMSVRRVVRRLKDVGAGSLLLDAADEIEFQNEGEVPLVLPLNIDALTYASKASVFTFTADQIAPVLQSEERITIPAGGSWKVTIPAGGIIDGASLADVKSGNFRCQVRLEFHDGLSWESADGEPEIVTTLTSNPVRWEFP